LSLIEIIENFVRYAFSSSARLLFIMHFNLKVGPVAKTKLLEMVTEHD